MLFSSPLTTPSCCYTSPLFSNLYPRSLGKVQLRHFPKLGVWELAWNHWNYKDWCYARSKKKNASIMIDFQQIWTPQDCKLFIRESNAYRRLKARSFCERCHPHLLWHNHQDPSIWTARSTHISRRQAASKCHSHRIHFQYKEGGFIELLKADAW